MMRSSARGQTLVEFALLLPMLLMMLVGVFDLGRVVFANDTVSNAAREAARFAIVHGGSSFTDCPVGPPGPDTVIPPASPACPYPSPSKEAIREVARSWAIAAGHSIVVEVCYGIDCTGDTDTLNGDGEAATNERGTPVTVTVRSTVSMAVPPIFGFDPFEVSGSSTMRVNN
jgi:hypothetical protein